MYQTCISLSNFIHFRYLINVVVIAAAKCAGVKNDSRHLIARINRYVVIFILANDSRQQHLHRVFEKTISNRGLLLYDVENIEG